MRMAGEDSTIDRDLRARLAALVVEALGVGTDKRERDVIDDLFAAFGVDFADVETTFLLSGRHRAGTLQEAAAGRLADAAPH